MKTPRQQGFRMPAEWQPHQSTWVSWPHEPTTWPGKLTEAGATMARWVRELTRPRGAHVGERVEINVQNETHEAVVAEVLADWDVHAERVRFHHIATADVWIRDYGPIFVTRPPQGDEPGALAVVAWEFDAWGGKGAQYYGEREGWDRLVPTRIAECLGVPTFKPGIILEGGGIDVNGKGTLMAARDCLLTHRTRHGESPQQVQDNVELKLHEYLAVDHFIWVDTVPFEGDDTDGHIDNLARFVAPDTIATAVAHDRRHPLYAKLQANLKRLERERTESGHPVTVIPIPLPHDFHYRWLKTGTRQRQQFPASYMNFYIGNTAVLVPIYADSQDVPALDLLSRCFPDRAVIPIDCCDYILGQGAIHCSTQQVPRVETRGSSR